METGNYNMAPENMRLSNDSRQFLLTTAKWAKFIAITTLALYGFMLLMFIIMAATTSGMSSYMGNYTGGAMGMYGQAMGSWVMVIVWIIVCAIYFIPMWWQLQFASRVKKAFAVNDELALTEAFRNLKNYYVFMGVMLIVGLAFIVLAMLLGVVGAAAMM